MPRSLLVRIRLRYLSNESTNGRLCQTVRSWIIATSQRIARVLPFRAACAFSLSGTVNVSVSSIEDFGSDRYTYVRGDDSRYQTGRVRTVHPADDETNEAFERRMDLLCRQLLGMGGIASVSVDVNRSRGAIVEAIVSVVES